MKNRLRQTFFAPMLCIFAVGFCYPTDAQERSAVTLFENVRIFDGKSASLSAASSVLGARQHDRSRISVLPLSRLIARADTRIIDGGGPRADARPDRQSLARDAGARDPRQQFAR